MKQSTKYGLLALGLIAAAAAAHPALAATFPKNSAGFPIHAPQPWEWWFQPASSPIQKSIDWMMQFVLWIMFGVVLLVAGLLAYIVVKFRASVHPVPSTTTHNTLIDVLWTGSPTLLLDVIFVT